jgi:uncharacterized protein involved in cysteine biosynthesis
MLMARRVLREGFWGLSLPLQALKMTLRNRVILAWSLLPFCLTLILEILFFRWWFGEISQQGWLKLVTWFAQGISLVVGGFLFPWLCNLLALPWNDFLSEKTEKQLTPPLEPVIWKGWSHWLKCLLIDAVKNLASLVMAGGLLLVSWIPIFSVVVLPLGWLLISFQYLSYAQTRRGMGFWQASIFVKNHLWSCLGFGFSFHLLFSIPFLSVFAHPLAIVGAVNLFARNKTRLFLPPSAP